MSLTSAARFDADQAVSPMQLAALVADPEQPLRDFAHCPVKLSHASLVVQAEIQLMHECVRVAYKRSRARSWWKALTAALRLRPSRAARGWRLGQLLTRRRVPTARPLFMLERGRQGDYLATQWIEGSTNLHLYLWELAVRPARERGVRLRQTADSIARVAAALHAAGCSHRDLKALNLVVRERPGGVEAWLVDLDGISPATIRARTRTRNLGRLAASLDAHPWISRSHRLRFLRAYLRSSALPSTAWKDFWRTIDQSRRTIRARIDRSGGPLS